VGERRLRSFSFVNPGPMELIVADLKLMECEAGNRAAPAVSSQFSVQRQPTLPHRMQPHETCKCVVAFHPSQSIGAAAVLVIVPSGAHPRQHVELWGSGVTTSPAQVAENELAAMSKPTPLAELPTNMWTPRGQDCLVETPNQPTKGPSAASLPSSQEGGSPHSGGRRPGIRMQNTNYGNHGFSPSVPQSTQATQDDPSEVSRLRTRVSQLEHVLVSYASEMSRHNEEVQRLFAELGLQAPKMGPMVPPGLYEGQAAGISLDDISGYEQCDGWENFAQGVAPAVASARHEGSDELIDINAAGVPATPAPMKAQPVIWEYRTEKPTTPLMPRLDAASLVDPHKGATPPPSALKFRP